MSDRKEITKFLGNLLENQYFSGIGKYWAKEVSVDLGSTEKAKRVDYMQFVPYELEDGFTSKDFARVCRINKSTAGLALNILNYMGMVKRTGKQGNSYIYEVE